MNPMIRCAFTRENVSKEEMNYVQTNSNDDLEHYMVPTTVLITALIIKSNVLLLIDLFKTRRPLSIAKKLFSCFLCIDLITASTSLIQLMLIWYAGD